MKFSALWRRIRQNKLFSSIYVLGSALSIASAMLIVIFIYVKVADIYPENDRKRVYELRTVDCFIEEPEAAIESWRHSRWENALSYVFACHISDEVKDIADVSLQYTMVPYLNVNSSVKFS